MGYAFVGSVLDRAEHLRDDPAALAALWVDARILVLDASGQAAARADGLGPRTQAPGGVMPIDAVFLGLDAASRGWFACLTQADQGGPWVDLRSAAATWPEDAATAFAQARAVLHWRARHRYCGACGAALSYVRAGWLGRCAGCDLEHYPRTDPAVIVAVSDGPRLLLGRAPHWPARRWSILAGFVEPGETLEQTVVREVFEEAGVRVQACRYVASQPWPFPSSLMLGFQASAQADAPVPNGSELEDARWFTRDEVGAALASPPGAGPVQLSPPLSISRWLIAQWHAAGG